MIPLDLRNSRANRSLQRSNLHGTIDMPNSRIKDAVIKGNLPNVLYKYRELSNFTEDLILKGDLFFTLPKNFNDPYEFNIKDSGTYTKQDVINYLVNNGETLPQATLAANGIPNVREYVSKLLDTVKEKKSSSIGVFCLSETLNNILMWAHYADSHKGCVVCIDVTKLPSDSYFPLKVKYQDQYPQMEYLKNSKNFLNEWALTKSNHWKYEKERRIVLNNQHGKITIPQSAIVEVIFGCKADPMAVKNLTSKILSSNPTVKIKQASLSHSNYEVLV